MIDLSVTVEKLINDFDLEILSEGEKGIEIFVNDGEQVLSTVIYTPRNAQDIVFETDGCVELEVEKYDLNI